MKLLFDGDVVLKRDDLDLSAVVDMSNYDYRIINFEAPVLHGGETPVAKAGPNLCQKLEALETIVRDGFNIVALANNHIFDYGKDAAFYTEELFQKRNVLTCGIGRDMKDAMRPVPLEKDGEKVAILNLAEGQFGVTRQLSDAGHAWIMSPVSAEGDNLSCPRDIRLLSLHMPV